MDSGDGLGVECLSISDISGYVRLFSVIFFYFPSFSMITRLFTLRFQYFPCFVRYSPICFCYLPIFFFVFHLQ